MKNETLLSKIKFKVDNNRRCYIKNRQLTPFIKIQQNIILDLSSFHKKIQRGNGNLITLITVNASFGYLQHEREL